MGAFLLSMSKAYSITVKAPYAKPWLSIDAQISKLEQRGLEIPDHEAASKFLSYINYYRFAGYALRFQHWDPVLKDRIFDKDVSFDDIRFICEFDRDLRDVFFEGLELVEISMRSVIAYKFAEKYGPFGHLKPENFNRTFINPPDGTFKISYKDWHAKIVRETERSKEIFVNHFQTHYTQFPDLPIWVVSEICSFGSLSEMLSNMLNKDQARIASVYKLQFDEMVSWAHALTYARNICAHHARLWDKTFRISPMLPASNANWAKLKDSNQSVYVFSLALNWMLAHDSIAKDAHAQWKRKLEGLMDKLQASYPKLFAATGFSENWKKNPLWWQY